jgi:class 3 adenylate cyclase/tetratricopeptide (TPR) repeat protein
MGSCPACGAELPGAFPFCPFCGAALEAAAPVSTARERKVVSVLFCDLVGFTATSESSDPEDVQARIERYHRKLRAQIEAYGGTVEKFIGDAVMAVFGAPVSHEDDPERAVRAGLEILRAIEELNDEDPGLDLSVRVGVNTGEAVVALHARPEQGEGMVAGDVVNTAARIQAAAPVGAVAVGEETFRQTERVILYEPLPAADAKGKADPIPLFRAVEPRGRFGADLIRTHESPFVGREVEKTLLQGLFERSVRDSSVQLVTLVGEPGVGKSRLVAELFGHLEELPDLITWRQGRCLPYGEGITFWALGEILKAHAGIYESDAPDAAARKLDLMLADTEDRPWLRARLLPLLGIDSGQAPSRDESFTAWLRFIEQIASTGPTVIVVEDLHWADPALLDFLAHLAEWSQGVPLLLVCTARPELFEKHSAWAGGLRNVQTISLSPLSDAETTLLVTALLEHDVSDDVRKALLERVGGNPFYAEEFVRLLADRGLDDGMAFPDSVQSLIAARLDTLSADRKALLHDAAVVGKVFWAGALAAMGDRPLDEVERALHELLRKELVRPSRTSTMEGEVEYAFWHALVRDVAYGQTARGDRARRHRSAASWLEGKAGERVEDLAEVLAHHYLQALELTEAAGDGSATGDLGASARRYLTLAAERAVGLDTARAEELLRQALALCGDDDPDRPELMTRFASALLQRGNVREAAETLDRALVLLRAADDREATARALMLRSEIAKGNAEAGHPDYAREAIALLEAGPHSATLVDAHVQLASSLHITGALAEAVDSTDRAIQLAEELGVELPARAHSIRGVCRAFLGDRTGLDEMETARRQLMEEGAGSEVARLMNHYAIVRYVLDGPAAAIDDFEHGVSFSRERGLIQIGTLMEVNLVETLAETGRVDEALVRTTRLALEAGATGNALAEQQATMTRAIILTARGDASFAIESANVLLGAGSNLDQFVTGTATIASALLLAGRPAEAHARLTELESNPDSRGNSNYPTVLPGIVRTALGVGDRELAQRLTERVEVEYALQNNAVVAARAQIAEHAGNHAEAAGLYATAGQQWEELGAVPEQAHALLGQGRCLLALDDTDAERPLAKAAALFREMGYLPALRETESLTPGIEA